jgi:hypothetical protein
MASMVEACNKYTMEWCNDKDGEKLKYVGKNYTGATLSTTYST